MQKIYIYILKVYLSLMIKPGNSDEDNIRKKSWKEPDSLHTPNRAIINNFFFMTASAIV